MLRHIDKLLPRRLQWRLSLPLAFLICVTMLGFGIYNARKQINLNEALIIAEGQGLARSIASSSIDPLLRRDIEEIENGAVTTMQYPHLLGIKVLDGRGLQVVDLDRVNGLPSAHFGREVPSPPTHLGPSFSFAKPNSDDHADIHLHQVRGEFIAWEPIVNRDGGHLGWVRVAMDMRHSNEAQHQLFMSTIEVTVVMLLLTLLVMYVHIRAPISELERARQFALSLDRQWGHQADGAPSITEIDQLFKALNQASVNLARQKEEISASRNFLENLTETLGEGVYATDKAGRCTFMNREAEHLLGWSRGDMLGQKICGWLHFHDPEHPLDGHVCTRTNAILSREICRNNNTHFVRKDGSQLPVSIVATPLMDKDQVSGAVVAFQDIRERLAFERSLYEARDAAEASSRAKSDFLANMSHEIRTPMNAIIGMAHLAMDTDSTPRRQDYLKKILGSAQHLLGILNDILEYSRLDAGKQQIELVDFELAKLLDSVATLFTEKASGKELRLYFDIDPNVPRHLIGDFACMKQILLNYAANAFKFTQEGRIDIIVKLMEQTDPDNVQLQFAVRDTGIGLSEEQQMRMFQKFQQADSSISRKFGGTGLGLAIAKQLAELMGGTVGVESRLGHGSTFWFTVRLGVGARKHVATVAPQRSETRVLVVDDAAMDRALLSRLLEDMGLRVTAVDSGENALATLAEAQQAGDPYGHVILDWQMPDMDGFKTAEHIMSLNLDNKPRLLILTAFFGDTLLTRAAATGINKVLMKPISRSGLYEAFSIPEGAPTRDGDSAWTRSAEDQAPDARNRPPRVLLVEDNPLNQELARYLLSQAGCDVAIADDVAPAIAMLKDAPYDLVLLDLRLPGGDGLDVALQAQGMPAHAQTPIIVLSANDSSEERQRCVEAGIKDVLGKPIDPDQLNVILRQYLPAREVELPGAATASTPVTTPAAVDPELLLLARQLRDLCNQSQLSAIHHLQSNAEQFRSAEPSLYGTLESALEEFDFDRAEHVLDAFLLKHGQPS
jgi:PAS domain S-box-containing protein